MGFQQVSLDGLGCVGVERTLRARVDSGRTSRGRSGGNRGLEVKQASSPTKFNATYLTLKNWWHKQASFNI